jgi:hypothetical protein
LDVATNGDPLRLKRGALDAVHLASETRRDVTFLIRVHVELGLANETVLMSRNGDLLDDSAPLTARPMNVQRERGALRSEAWAMAAGEWAGRLVP